MNHVEEIMRLANLLATARCRRMAANTRNGGRTNLDIAEALVTKQTAALRAAVELAVKEPPCPE